ncbi:MAG: phosphoribosylamine--glycine ligase [Proteobacteria bacterium]|nr:phosphoribosylamine--glycine ligase [Pseudomonadota bacterium]
MKILIVGGGGREHALAWKCAQSDKVSEVIVAPGNAGTALEAKVRNVAISAEDIDALLQFAITADIDLTIVGPETPLVNGIVDLFEQAGLRCFGPSAAAAQLEGSKSFSKDFLQRHGIPTAEYQCFTELEPALDYIRNKGAPIVVKADGLAAGKGVVVAATVSEAVAAAEDMLGAGRFGEAGRRIVVEEFLAGEEVSFIVMTDGYDVLPLATSQDHKTRDDGDSGPNTGGMGACSPAPIVTEALQERVMNDIIHPTLRGLAAENIPYRGFLYAGLMIAADGSPKVLEYNCRFGDPETQPIMSRLKSDLAELCEATLDGTLNAQVVEWDSRAALGVVMAAGGYPNEYAKGHVISGLPEDDDEGSKVFHAGTRIDGADVVTSGGRVLCVVGLGESLLDAKHKAYEIVAGITWADEFHRNDIGQRAVARE